jgi:hypothetical protein
VVQSTQDWQGEDLAIVVIRRNGLPKLCWDLLCDALMWPSSIEILGIGMKEPIQLLLLENEQVIETFTSHTPHKPLTDGIRSWGVVRCSENLDATRVCNSSEASTKLAIVITDEVLRPHAVGGSFAQRYARPMHRWESASRPHG